MSTPEKKLSPIVTVQKFFTAHRDQMMAALPKHLTPDRMARLAMTAVSQSSALADCDARSIFGAVIAASQLGLEIGVSGHGFLVPYKGKATFVPGWQGIVDLVSRSGRGTCWTGAVFEGDEFDYELGDSPRVKHRPCGEYDPALMTHTYAIGRPKGSEWPIIEVWPIVRVWKHRDRFNKVGGAHYSYKHLEMYARKIPLLQVLKYMPKSVELTAALELSNRVDEGRHATIDGNFLVVSDDDAPPQVTTLRDRIKSTKPTEDPPAQQQDAAGTDTAPADTDAAPAAETVYSCEKLVLLASQAEDPEDLEIIRTLRDANLSDDAQKKLVNKAIADRAKQFGRDAP